MTTAALSFYGTSIGKKVVMALTGIILFGFVVVHMLGNLQVYAGPEQINAYGVLLRKYPALLWVARLTLLVTVLLHVVAGVQLKLQNLRARGGRYQRFTPVESTLSSRRMIWTGVMIAFFVVYHLLHFTFGTVLPGFAAGDIYRNFVIGFSIWPVSVAYLIAMVLLGLHLVHGLQSMFQSLGLNLPKYLRLQRGFAIGFAIILVAGNISMPAAVLAGWIR